MVENFKNKVNTNGFKENPNNINRTGRPKKIFNILKESGYNKTDIRTACLEIAFYTIDEIIKLLNNKNTPTLIRIIANQYLQAIKKGDWNKIKDILEQTIGKPKHETNNQTNENFIPAKIEFVVLENKNND